MKIKHLPLLLAATGLLHAPSRLWAQDKDKPADAKPAEETIKPGAPPEGEKDKDKPQGDRHDGDRGNRKHKEGEHNGPDHRGPHEPEMKPTPFIGVMTRNVSPEVRAQTGLADGFGLLVEEVMPESPAKTAGLKQHDVLVLLGDQRLVNQEQLAVLVRSNAKDSEIVFTIKRAGAEQKVTVKVGEKMMPVTQNGPPPGQWGGQRGMPSFGGVFGGQQMQHLGQDLREGAERFRSGMKEFQERMQDWARGPKDKPMPQPPQFGGDNRGPGPQPNPGPGDRRGPQPQGNRPDGDKGPGEHRGPGGPPNQGKDRDGKRPGPDGGPRPQSTAEASAQAGAFGPNVVVNTSNSFQRNITRRDDSGEYSLRQDGGNKVFTVKPVDGEAQTFTVTTEDQRQAVPEALRVKLNELDEVSGRVQLETPGEAPAPTEERTTTI